MSSSASSASSMNAVMSNSDDVMRRSNAVIAVATALDRPLRQWQVAPPCPKCRLRLSAEKLLPELLLLLQPPAGAALPSTADLVLAGSCSADCSLPLATVGCVRPNVGESGRCCG